MASAASTAFRGAFHRRPTPTAVPPILALPTELSQKILRHTITDSDIARDPTNPLELVAQYHKLRLVCWKWAGEMEHVMKRWKARRVALLDSGGLEDEVVAYSRKAEIWWTMREMWRNGELTQEEVDVVERRIAVAKMRGIRKDRKRRARRAEKKRQERVKKEQRKKVCGFAVVIVRLC
ncbi:hypothetical protein SLS54_007612 [Diplodia seriata]